MIYTVIKNSRFVRALIALFNTVFGVKENSVVETAEEKLSPQIKPAEKLSFRKAQINKIAHEYYRLLTDYGVESASAWLDRQLKSQEDVSLFRAMQHDIAKRYGFIS